MADCDVIIIGAGASGLMAARELVRLKHQVIVLEARDRLGGRIHTLSNQGFLEPVELGAEFLHGKLPVTIRLLNEAGIEYYPTMGQSWQSRNGELRRVENYFEDWPLLEQRLRELKKDMSIADFLNLYFAGEEYARLRQSIKGFVEGYDAADTGLASTFALRDEWLGEEESSQYRIRGGYGRMIDFLADECKLMGGIIHLSSVVKEVSWQQGSASVIAKSGEKFQAKKVVITVPLGILQLEPESNSAISFIPDIPKQRAAAQSMGNGSVIKILMQFKKAFWKDTSFVKRCGEGIKKMGFVFSDATIPTWWTQYPEDSSMLTGWFAGPKSEQFKAASEETLFKMALTTLASIFNLAEDKLLESLTTWIIVNWVSEPFSLGAYTYATLNTHAARKVLEKPVENTLFFAGEALYNGPEMGTVEAALASGKKLVAKMVKG